MFFMAGDLREKDGSPRPDPAEDMSCHSPTRQDFCFGAATINLSPVPSAHAVGSQDVGEASCKEHQEPGLSSSQSLEMAWWFRCLSFLPHPLIPACVLLLLLEMQ